MEKINFIKTSVLAALIVVAVSCDKAADNAALDSTGPEHPVAVTKDMMLENGDNPDELAVTENAGLDNGKATGTSTSSFYGRYLYTESNAEDKNEILSYEMKYNGKLTLSGKTASGGKGTGAGLGTQGALVIDKDQKYLFAVNAGSNSISSFSISKDGGLALVDTKKSYGKTPVSVTVHNNLVYVLNRGTDNIAGFKLSANGSLTYIEGSKQPLSSTAVDAPQISITPDCNYVIVTEKATDKIGSFKIKDDGSVNAGVFSNSVGKTPFGFEFSRNRFMVVSNAAGGAPAASTVTSYNIKNGVPKDINGAVANNQAAACWVAIAKHGRYAFITNTADNTISSYYIAPWGGLYLVEEAAAKSDMGPVDIVVAGNNFFVYVLNGKSGTIGGYYRKFFGGLRLFDTTPGLPLSATGLATY